MFFATLLVASFAYILSAAPTAYAASANWNGGNISYDARDYSGPVTATDNDKSTLPKGTIYFTAFEQATQGKSKGYLIYFDSGTNLKTATSATYVTSDYDVASGKFSNLSPPDKIEVDKSSYGNAETVEASSCDVSGIGWIICPVSKWIAEGMDFLYGLVSAYLNVAPITGGNNGLYEMWKIVRSVANVGFIIGFLVVIYSQVSGGLLSNYTVKKMLPRIIIAAVFVNISYWVCAIGVDISNILGHSVQELFMSMVEKVGAANSRADDIGWVQVTAAALGGGGLVIVGGLAATGGGAGALAFLIIAALIPALFAVFVAVAILAARQALLTVLIIISPLAFVAYLLPNTEEWFHRWRKFFTSLLVMFPAFAVVFGGAQLAGIVIIQNANNLPTVILGLLIQVIPLFVTPLLIKLSSGLLGTIAGITNDRSKGVFDRAKGWADSNREYHKARAINNGMDQNRRGRRFRPTTAGARLAASKMHREKMTSAYNASAEARYGSTRRGEKSYTANKLAGIEQGSADAKNEETLQRRLSGDETRQSRLPIVKKIAENENKRYANYQHMQHETHRAQSSAKIIEDGIHDEGEREFRQGVADGSTPYNQRLRATQARSVVDKGLATNAQKEVDALGGANLAETILTSDHLQRQVIRTHESDGRATQANELVEDKAKSSWQRLTLRDETIYSRQLERQSNAKDLKSAQDEWESILVEASAGSTADYERRFGTSASADVDASIQKITTADQTIAVEAHRKANAEHTFKSALTKQLQSDSALLERAAGIDEQGKAKVIAQLSKEGSALHMQNVEAVESYMANEGFNLEEEKRILQGGNMRDGTKPSAMHRHAALRRIMLSNGNNWAAQETYDYVVSQGMEYSQAANNGAGGFVDENGTVLSDAEASDRRDLQQIFKDADAKSHLKVDYLSGTDKGHLENGMLMRKDKTRTASEQALLRDIGDGKIDGDRAFASDIDVIMRQVQIFKDPQNVNRLSSTQRAKYVKTLNDMLTDPLLGRKMSERNWGMTKVVANLLDESDQRPVTDKVRSYVNRDGEPAKIEKPVETDYKYEVNIT